MAFRRKKKTSGEQEAKTTAKYHSKKVTVDGITFDSKKEARYYEQLKKLKADGIVSAFAMQQKFVLIDKFRYKGKAIRECSYIADFVVNYADKHVEVVDVKGFRTETYKLKRKLLLSRYPDINFIEI